MIVALGPSSWPRRRAPDFDLLIRGGRVVDGTGNPSYLARRRHQGGPHRRLGRLAGPDGRADDRGRGPRGRAGLRGHPQPLGRDAARGRRRREHGAPGRDHDDPRRGRVRGAERPLPGLPGLLRRPARRAGSPPTSARTSGRARSGPRSTGRARARRAGGARSDARSSCAGRWSRARSAWPARSAARRERGSTPTRWSHWPRWPASTEGRYSTHIRNEGTGVWDAVAEAIEIGRRARVPVDIIHLKIAEHTLWKQMPKLVAQIAAAREQGLDVQANVYPYRAGQNDLQTILPPWAHEGGREAMLARLADPRSAQRMEREILGGMPGWYNHYTAVGSWEGMLLVSLSAPEYKRFEGKRMSDVIAAFPGREADGRAVRHARRQRRLRPDRLFPSRRGGHAIRAAAALRLRRLGRDGGEDRRADGEREPASALLRNVRARARALRARGEGAHAGGRRAQDDVRQHRQGPRLRPRPPAARANGRTSPCSTPAVSSTRPRSRSRTNTPPGSNTSS